MSHTPTAWTGVSSSPRCILTILALGLGAGGCNDPRPYVLVVEPLDQSVLASGVPSAVVARVVQGHACDETPTLAVYIGDQTQADWTIGDDGYILHDVSITDTTDVRMTVTACGLSDTAHVHLCVDPADCGGTVATPSDTDPAASTGDNSNG